MKREKKEEAIVDRTQGRRLSPEEISRSFTRYKKKKKKEKKEKKEKRKKERKKGKGQVRGDATLEEGRRGQREGDEGLPFEGGGERVHEG